MRCLPAPTSVLACRNYRVVDWGLGTRDWAYTLGGPESFHPGGAMTRRLLFVCLTVGFVHTQSAAAATCDSLASLPLQNAHIISAQMVAAGAFTVPAAPGRGARAAAPGAEGAAAP